MTWMQQNANMMMMMMIIDNIDDLSPCAIRIECTHHPSELITLI